MRKYELELSRVDLTSHDTSKPCRQFAGLSYDCVFLAATHDKLNCEIIKTSTRLIVDTRTHHRRPANHIVKA